MNKLESALTIIIILILSILIADISPYDDFNEKLNKEYIDKINCIGYLHNGIDRIDNNIGYESKNVVSCCKICNYAKSNMNYKDFILWIQKAAAHTKAMAEQWGGKC